MAVRNEFLFHAVLENLYYNLRIYGLELVTYFLLGKFDATEEVIPFCSPSIPFDIPVVWQEQIVASNKQRSEALFTF